VSLPRHIREAGRRAVEEKLGEIFNPTTGGLKASKTKQLGGLPDANIPKVVSFPSS
jgi:hypothetical protein